MFISKQKYGSRFEPKLQIYKAKILGYFVVWNRIKRGHLRMQDLWRNNHGMGREPLPSFVHHRNWYHSCFSVSKYGNLQRFVLIIIIYFKKSKEGKVEKIKLAWIQKITKTIHTCIHIYLMNSVNLYQFLVYCLILHIFTIYLQIWSKAMKTK